MQVLAQKRETEEKPTVEPAPGAAHLSLRAVTCLEIASIIVSVLITTWAIMPLQPRQRWLAAIPALLAVALMTHSHVVRGEHRRELGFTFQYFGRAMKLLALPTLAACAAFVAIGVATQSLHRTTHFWGSVVVAPVWALIQQYVLQAFIYRRLRFVLPDGRGGGKRAILTAATIFALVHAPNPALMVLTFAGALLWSWVYERAPNLFALALSHAAISLMLMTSLPPWLLESMSVGYKHFLYQKF